MSRGPPQNPQSSQHSGCGLSLRGGTGEPTPGWTRSGGGQCGLWQGDRWARQGPDEGQGQRRGRDMKGGGAAGAGGGGGRGFTASQGEEDKGPGATAPLPAARWAGTQVSESSSGVAEPQRACHLSRRRLWAPRKQRPVSPDTRHSVEGEASGTLSSHSSRRHPGVVLRGRRACDRALTLWQTGPRPAIFLSWQRCRVAQSSVTGTGRGGGRSTWEPPQRGLVGEGSRERGGVQTPSP